MNRRDNLLNRLKQAQKADRYVSGETISELAGSLEIPENEVYGTASFYSFLAVAPQGRNVIRVCKCLPCYLKNSLMIIESVENQIGIAPGETTDDKRFTFELTHCIGACDQAPAMLINNDVHGFLTSEKISRILSSYE